MTAVKEKDEKESKALMEHAKDKVTLDELMIRQPPWPEGALETLIAVQRRERARFQLSERKGKRKGTAE